MGVSANKGAPHSLACRFLCYWVIFPQPVSLWRWPVDSFALVWAVFRRKKKKKSVQWHSVVSIGDDFWSFFHRKSSEKIDVSRVQNWAPTYNLHKTKEKNKTSTAEWSKPRIRSTMEDQRLFTPSAHEQSLSIFIFACLATDGEEDTFTFYLGRSSTKVCQLLTSIFNPLSAHTTDISVIEMIISVAVWRIYPSWLNETRIVLWPHLESLFYIFSSNLPFHFPPSSILLWKVLGFQQDGNTIGHEVEKEWLQFSSPPESTGSNNSLELPSITTPESDVRSPIVKAVPNQTCARLGLEPINKATCHDPRLPLTTWPTEPRSSTKEVEMRQSMLCFGGHDSERLVNTMVGSHRTDLRSQLAQSAHSSYTIDTQAPTPLIPGELHTFPSPVAFPGDGLLGSFFDAS